jgi:hypothetical protein
VRHWARTIDLVPLAGGTADKLGNRYEALWAFDRLLSVVDGRAAALTLEPLDSDESRGIEFVVCLADGTSEYWSVKRQTTKAAGWTLAVLAAEDERGRSILRDLLGHVERSSTNRAVFASTLGARDFEELKAYSSTSAALDARLKRSTDLQRDYRNYLLPLCSNDSERARAFLLRASTHAVDEAHLRQQTDVLLRKTFYVHGGGPLDAVAVRGHLAELLLDRIHQPIDRGTILQTLRANGVCLREWALERTVTDRVDSIRLEYLQPLLSQRINGRFLELPASEPIVGHNGLPASSRILVSGSAGGGKSTTLASVLERLAASQVPVLPVRFDQLPDGILTTTELGSKLLLPESPVLVLAGLAAGKPCVLFVDQLDAVSLASGRRAELWSLFEGLLRESERFPEVSVIVGCREFDLEHDHRMRGLKSDGTRFTLVTLKALSAEQVDEALTTAATDPRAVASSLKPVLFVPLHLSMFLNLRPADRISIRNRDELFDRFWTDAERRSDQRLGHKAAWTQVIDKLANWLSVNQQLSAPRFVLDEFAADAAAMASEHVLVLAEGRYRFFHESFFDYAFARRFAAGTRTLVDLLLSGEQHLFRRAQARQVLAFLRSQDPPRYLAELELLLGQSHIRFHIKRVVLQWLSTLPDAQHEEWAVLRRISDATPELWPQVRASVIGQDAWFDVLDAAGFFDEALASGNQQRQEEALWMLGVHTTMTTRSFRVAALLTRYRQ